MIIKKESQILIHKGRISKNHCKVTNFSFNIKVLYCFVDFKLKILIKK